MIFKSKNNQGFTLVEVMVTIAVSGILFAMIAAVVASFVNSYKHSTRIRELNYEVEAVEHYVTITIDSFNASATTLIFTKDETGFTLADEEGILNTFKYTKEIIEEEIKHIVSLSPSNTTLELEYIKNIEAIIQINDSNIKTGLVLTITTIDNTTFVSYYKVLNLLESGGN